MGRRLAHCGIVAHVSGELGQGLCGRWKRARCVGVRGDGVGVRGVCVCSMCCFL